MSNIFTYGVVMFQGGDCDGSYIFGSDTLKECQEFAEIEKQLFEELVKNGLPEEVLPKFVIVAYHDDQSTSIVGE